MHSHQPFHDEDCSSYTWLGIQLGNEPGIRTAEERKQVCLYKHAAARLTASLTVSYVAYFKWRSLVDRVVGPG